MKISAALLSLLAVAFLEGVNSAGREEIVLIDTKSAISQDTPERISYQCTFRNLWTKERQPKNFPQQLGRWNGPIMWTHTLQFQPWHANFAVTRGVEKLAEDGYTDTLIKEMQQQGEQVHAWSDYNDIDTQGGFWVREKDFIHMPPIESNKLFPYMSVMAGMAPSPDWYTGFYSYWMIDEYSRTYYDHLKIQTYPWDAGTDAGQTYKSLKNDLDPSLPIEKMISRTAPTGGELSSPDGSSVPVVAEWECFLVIGDEDMILPDCDWFANPCCNETDTKNCGAALPNGALPALSPEYRGVQENSPNSASGAVSIFSLTTLAAGLAAMQWVLA